MKPYILGITGGSGVGKSTVTRMLKRLGTFISDADQIVHDLYNASPLLQQKLAALFPNKSGPFTRPLVSQLILKTPSLLPTLESVIHPLVFQAHQQAIDQAYALQAPLIALDIPLLFETGWEIHCDGVLLVTCSSSLQRHRLLKRPHMIAAKMDLLLSRQGSEEDKRRRCDFVIDTTEGKRVAFQQLRFLLNKQNKTCSLEKISHA